MATNLPRKDQKVIEALKKLGLFEVEYPLEQLAIRRAIFRSQAKRLSKRAQKLQEQQVITHLENLGAAAAGYDAQLFAARRATFSTQIKQQKARVEQAKEQEVINLLESLKTNQVEYPAKLQTARRLAFLNQVTKQKRVTWPDTFQSTVQHIWNSIGEAFQPSMRRTIYATLILAVLVLATSLGSLTHVKVPEQLPAVAQAFSFSTSGASETPNQICDSASPSPCLISLKALGQDLSSQHNGFARAAVAKDALSGSHQAALANDGVYGNDSSWISQSAYSWLKIDLGKVTLINTVAVTRDYSGTGANQNSGEFMISTSLADNVYANGNSSNDAIEFKQVYDSKSAGLIGDLARSGTVIAYFEPVNARFIKITFANPGTAVDEVAIFMSNSVTSLATEQSNGRGTKTQLNNPGQPANTLIPIATFTSVPTNTPLPTNTRTAVPTNTLPPTSTITLVPTDTPIPTDTPTWVPTDTAVPTDTPTVIPLPTDTPQPVNTDTAVPIPTDTSVPIPTDTSAPIPTDTSVPPIISTP